MSKRPDPVPAGAVFNEAQKQWEHGAKNGVGKHVGHWRWWHPDTGALVAETWFTDDGGYSSYKRYHPSGTLGEEGTFEGTRVATQSWYPSAEPSPLRPPVAAPTRNVHQIRKVPGSVPVTYEFLDASGVRLDARGRPLADTEMIRAKASRFVRGPASESWQQALDRFDAFLSFLATEQARAPDDEFLSNNRIRWSTPVTKKELAAVEARYGVVMPPSYVAVVTKRGLFSFADRVEAAFLPPAELISIWDWHVENGHHEEDLATEFDLDAAGISRWKTSIAFAFGDEQLQLRYHWCFRFDSQDPATREVVVWGFDQDAPIEHARPTEPCTGAAMDRFFSRVVDERIAEIFEYEFAAP